MKAARPSGRAPVYLPYTTLEVMVRMEMCISDRDFIIDSAYDSVYGARPIKRFIQSRVETLIAKAIIQGSYAEGSTLTVDYDGSAPVSYTHLDVYKRQL